jgi:hypothetical protein
MSMIGSRSSGCSQNISVGSVVSDSAVRGSFISRPTPSRIRITDGPKAPSARSPT